MAGEVDVERDGFFLEHVLKDTGYPEIATFIKKAFDTVIPRKAVDFKTNVALVINQCLQMHGVPMFRTRYAKEPFPMRAVLMVCYGSHNGRMKGVWLKDTPPDDLNMLAAKKDGYRLMLGKYGKGIQIQYPAVATAPWGAVSFGGGRFTGQAMVSEAIDELQYLLNRQQVSYEEFESAWMREFPGMPVPTEPVYKFGKVYTFRTGYGMKVPTALEASLKAIEEKLDEALADEEKAVPFYKQLRGDLYNAGLIKPLSNESFILGKIIQDEERHKKELEQIKKTVQGFERPLELEPIGKMQRMRQLERRM